MVAEAGPGVTGVVRVSDESSESLAAFLRLTWDPGATADGVRRSRAAAAAANPHGAGTDVPTFLFLNRGEPVGHLGTIPVRLHLPSGEVDAHWLKGLMVLPEHRGGPVGFLLIKEALKHVSWSMALVVASEARRLFTALKYRDAGAMGDFLRVLDAPGLMKMDVSHLPLSGPGGRLAGMVGRLQRYGLAGAAGVAARASLGAWTAVAGRGRGEVSAGAVSSIAGQELDELWQRASSGMQAALVRGGEYLQRRYAGAAYTTVLVRRGGRAAAVAVVRLPSGSGDPRLAGIRVATLSDLVAADASAALAAIAGAERAARQTGAQAIIAGATHATMRGWLARRAYMPLGGRVHFLVRGPDGAHGPERLDDWWLTRGDSDADEVF